MNTHIVSGLFLTLFILPLPELCAMKTRGRAPLNFAALFAPHKTTQEIRAERIELVKQIEQTEKDDSLEITKRHTLLQDLNKRMSQLFNPESSKDKAGYDYFSKEYERHKAILDDMQEQHEKALLSEINRQQRIKVIDNTLNRIAHDTSRSLYERRVELIPFYQELAELDAKRCEECKARITEYQILNCRHEFRNLIEELQKTGGEASHLLRTYEGLRSTYSNVAKEHGEQKTVEELDATIFDLKGRIERIEALNKRKLQTDTCIIGLTATIVTKEEALTKTNQRTFAALDELAGLYQKRAAVHASDTTRYASQAHEDAHKAHLYRLESITNAPNEYLKKTIIHALE